MIITALILIIGLIILAKAGESSIKYSIKVSNLTGISQMAIGCLVISVITAIPEISVALISALSGNAEIGVGNLLGSNIIDISLVFGMMAIFKTIKPGKSDYRELIQTLALTSTIAFLFIILKEINIIFGIFCLAAFALFFLSAWKDKYKIKIKQTKYKNLKIIETIKSFNYLILSLIFVVASAKFVTDSAVVISQAFGLSQALIGATIIATGTTLPELSIALIAIRRKNISLAIGDLIGSLVINLTLVFGIISLISVVPMTGIIYFLTIFLLITNMIFLFLSSTLKYSRLQGILLLLIYLIFIISAFAYQIFFI